MSDHAPHIVYLGLGSNLGHPADNLKRAVAALNAVPVFTVDSVSDVYLTEPQGLRDQEWFANMVIRILVHPRRTPEHVLDIILTIENDMGRVRSEVWGPRIIDLDLLLFNNVHICSDRLCLPHPRMHERAFVLVPLVHLAPDLLIGTERAIDCLARLHYTVDGNRIWQAEDTNATLPNYSGHTR